MGKHLQNPATEALNMNSQKITGLANGTASGDAVNYGQFSAITGMPSGSSGQTIRHNGSAWVASSVLANDGSNVLIGGAASLARLTVQDVPTSSTDVKTVAVFDAEWTAATSTGGGTAIEFRGKSSGGNIANWTQARLRTVGYAGNNEHAFAIDVAASGAGLVKGLSVNQYGLGIGTDDPQGVIHAYKSYPFLIVEGTGTAVSAAVIMLKHTAGGGTEWWMRSGSMADNTTTSFAISKDSYTNDFFKLTADHLCGIGAYYGTTDPVATLDLRPSSSLPVLLGRNNSGTELFRFAHDGFFSTSGGAVLHALGSNSMTLDASAAASSPATALIVKGRSSGITRFLDVQDGGGTAVFRSQIDVGGTAVKLSALNSYTLRLDGGAHVTLGTSSDKNLKWHTDGWLGMGGALTADPATTPDTGAIWWRNDLGRIRLQKSGSVATIATVEDDLSGNATQVVTASTHTLSGKDFFTRYSASSNAITVTLGDSLEEGKTYRVRCTGNGTNTVTFSAGGSNVFYVDEKSTTTLTSLVCGGSGTGIEAPNRILTICRRDTVIWIK